MLIEKKKVTELLPADYNPRKDLKPGDPEYEKLKRSIEQFGYVEPVIWNSRTGCVVGFMQLKVSGRQASDVVWSKVTVDGVDFYLRELSGKARIDFENEKDLQLRVLKMMHASLCDADGNLTEKPEDFNAFMESVPNKVLNALVNAFSALNITDETS